MSLIERLSELKRDRPSPFELWVADLPEDDRTALLAAAADPTIRHRELYEILRAEGAAVGRERMTEWRKRNGFPR